MPIIHNYKTFRVYYGQYKYEVVTIQDQPREVAHKWIKENLVREGWLYVDFVCEFQEVINQTLN